jgi:AGCS family alanine or glycine:cation symporter
MILGMAFPNLIGVYFLHGRVRNAINEYWARYKSGAMPVYK